MTTRVAPGTPTAERIRAHVVLDENGCWIWQCRLGRDGYGRITIGGKRGMWAHRVSYETFVAPIPDGMTVDHLCFVPACVNPDHMRLLSNAENASNQRRKFSTHCKHGHEYTPENTYRWRTSRICKACGKARKKLASQNRAAPPAVPADGAGGEGS